MAGQAESVGKRVVGIGNSPCKDSEAGRTWRVRNEKEARAW